MRRGKKSGARDLPTFTSIPKQQLCTSELRRLLRVPKATRNVLSLSFLLSQVEEECTICPQNSGICEYSAVGKGSVAALILHLCDPNPRRDGIRENHTSDTFMTLQRMHSPQLDACHEPQRSILRHCSLPLRSPALPFLRTSFSSSCSCSYCLHYER